MNCKRIKEIISTDYMDEELSESMQEEVRLHLKTCAECRAFEQALRQKVSEPLRKIEPLKPPEVIWERIQKAIDEEERVQYSPSLLDRAYDFLRGTLLRPKPAFAFSSAFAVVLISIVLLGRPFYRHWTVGNYLVQQSEAMQYVSLSSNGELENALGFGGDDIVNLFF